MDCKKRLTYTGFILFLLMHSFFALAQINRPLLDTSRGNIGYDNQGRPIKKDTTNLSLQHRDPLADSITISFRYFDSTQVRKLDSSIGDFYARFPIPYYYADLGNFGSAAHSLIFRPYMKPGWDAGFHAYDIYNFTVENTKFFQTTRPYTELGYLIGGKGEQMVNIITTQNRKSNLNFTFEFRFINSPGAFKSQNTSHNNIRVNTFYQGKNKRYGNYFIYINNKLRSAENGGLQDDNKLDSLSLNDPFEAETRLGSSATSSRNFFNTNITTGNSYNESTFFFRQYYDFGQKDSLVQDTITYKLFYPRIRLQHSIKYSRNSYTFQDKAPNAEDYYQFYRFILSNDTITYNDNWQNLTNDFSIISYPEKNNLNQFLKLGAGYEIIRGEFYPYVKNYNNIYAAGEYRNRTRNKRWDIIAKGQFYATGDYAGDYSAFISLKKLLGKRDGSFEVGFQNVNRTPSFVASQVISSFPAFPDGDFKKENISRLFADIEIPSLALTLTGEYYAITNYVYFDNFYESKQESTLFNILHVGADKTFRLGKHWIWFAELHVQQAAGNPPVNVPFIFTRNRIAFEGNFYKNLFLSTGIETRYYSAYKADNYSPFSAQFFFQDQQTITNRPDINAFFNFRIKSFKGFLRLENLNTLANSDKGIGFTHYNFTAPHYPARSMWFRFGIWWSFVN